MLKTLGGVHTNSIRGISVTRCGRYICTGCPDKKVGVWDAMEDYRLCAEFTHTHNIYAVAAAKDKSEKPRILFGSADNLANIVNVWAGEADEDGVHRNGIVVSTFEGHTDCCAAVDWSECCTRIVTGGDDKQAFVFDVATESIVTALVGHSSYVLCCAFGSGMARDSEGTLVPSRCLTGSNDRTAVMWDAVAGAQLRVFVGHAHAIWGVAFAPSGKQIATSSQDATVALWSVDSDTKLLALSGHVGTIFDVDFSRDGETLISAGRDFAIGVWLLSPPVHSSDVIAALRPEDDIEGTTTSFLLQSSSLNNTWAVDEVDGGNVIHSLAACYSNAWPLEKRYEEVIGAWFDAGAKQPYYPLVNDEGVTPLELAIDRSNRHFIAGLFRTKNILASGDGGASTTMRLSAAQRSRTGVEADVFKSSLLTARDLKALVNFWPALAVLFFVDSELLAAAPKHVAEGCNSFSFTRDFEVLGSDHGPSEPAGLWGRYASTLAVRLRGSICRRRGTAEQVHAQIFAMPGLSGAPYSYGHDALRGFVNGGNQMLDAFDTDAMHVLTEFRWRKFGQIGYTIRIVLFIIHLTAHSFFIALERDYDASTLLSTDPADEVAKAKSWAVFHLGVALIPSALCWLLSETAQISNLGANWKEYFRDLYNWNDLASSIATIIVVICVFAEVDQGVTASIASLASLLVCLRLFEIVRGVPGLGFYPFLIIEAVTDMRPFLFVLFVTATAFSVSMLPLAKEELTEESGASKPNPFYRLDTSIYRTFLMTLGDWDTDEITSSENAYSSQGLFAIFLVFVPIVMLSMLISILGDTFDRVTEQQSRVVAKQRMQVTMHVEAEIYALTCCCRKRFDAWARPRWYPRWLHVLRPKTHDGAANWKGRMQRLYSKIEKHGLEAADSINELVRSVGEQHTQMNAANQERHDELTRDLRIRMKAIDSFLRSGEAGSVFGDPSLPSPRD